MKIIIENKRKKKIIAMVVIFLFISLQLFVIAKSQINRYNINVWDKEEKKYIKWVDCNLTVKVLEKTSKLDIESHINDDEIKLNWIELISYLACRYGNEFGKFRQKDLDNLVSKLREGKSIDELTEDLEYYNYYFESYSAILSEFIGEYEIEVLNENNEKVFQKKYGIKAFLPVAKNYGFSHYKDFGNSRDYGYKRVHLGNDLMGEIGTPIIAVESGIVEAVRMEPIWRMANRY